MKEEAPGTVSSGTSLSAEGYEDILFRGKPKEYGAYRLRMTYHRNLALAIFLGMSLIAIGYILPLWIYKASLNQDQDKKFKIAPTKTIEYSQLSAPPPVEVEMPVEQAQIMPPDVKLKTVKFLKPELKPDEEVAEEELPPTQTELDKTNFGKENVDGVDSLVGYVPVAVAAPPEPAPVPEPVKPKPKPEPEPIFDFISKSPEFPGGYQELRKYLTQNVIYPYMEKESGLEGKVVVDLVIEKDGRISKIKIVKSAGKNFDKEVIRVVKEMPPWEPGENGGVKVRSRVVVPVKFELRS